MSGELVALNNNWLENTTATVAVSNSLGAGSNTFCIDNNLPCTPTYYVQPASWYYSYSGPARPIKLTFSEVERLRSAAKRDAKIKKILAKFTDQIELIVDFE